MGILKKLWEGLPGQIELNLRRMVCDRVVVNQTLEKKMLQALETEFSTIIGQAGTTLEKLEALVGLHAKASAVSVLQPQLSGIMANAALTDDQKVEAILVAVGKL